MGEAKELKSKTINEAKMAYARELSRKNPDLDKNVAGILTSIFFFATLILLVLYFSWPLLFGIISGVFWMQFAIIYKALEVLEKNKE